MSEVRKECIKCLNYYNCFSGAAYNSIYCRANRKYDENEEENNCLQCGKNEAGYCEECYQKLIGKHAKLQNENKELKQAIEINKRLYETKCKEYKQLEEDNEQLEATKNEAIRRYNFETILKSKVKEKIEETEKQIDNLVQNGDVYGDNLVKYNDLKLKIEVLQELLEEENK